MCDQGVRLTFAEMKREVDRLATGLLALGLQPGDRIGIWSPNNAAWVLTQYATAKAGLRSCETSDNPTAAPVQPLADWGSQFRSHYWNCGAERRLSVTQPSRLQRIVGGVTG